MRSAEGDATPVGWQAISTAPGAWATPADVAGDRWHPAAVPGTAAGVLRDAGVPRWDRNGLDDRDWWFRAELATAPAAPGERLVLRCEGIATVSEVYVGGERLLTSDSMFARLEADVTGHLARGRAQLLICCRALTPLLAVPGKPRARWRTRVVADGNLRFHRTMLLGRAPGFAPAPAVVGPWRPVLIERRRSPALTTLSLRPRLAGADGSLTARVAFDGPLEDVPTLELSGPSGTHAAELRIVSDAGRSIATGELRIPGVERWWPHTHGRPVLHDVRVRTGDGAALAERRAGFRSLAAGSTPGHVIERDGLDLHVNGVRVFARGAVWTPLDLVGMAPGREQLRAAIVQARDAGMNMLRVAGTSAYEAPDFHDLCDELGILVWQDFMFANLDYPIGDDAFRATVQAEAEQVLGDLAGRPSLAVLCGNSEVEQQVAMLGLEPSLGRGELFGELLPDAIAHSGADALYVPSAPCGGERPFCSDGGVANYFGVGGYRRPLEDVRRADVRFASECLALANVPCDDALGELLAGDPGPLRADDPRWKAGVARDAGSAWDFDDVRDHYLTLLFGVDPEQLRSTDHDRYWELSRIAGGEVMAEVFGEWRRAGSRCGGGLVLWLRDLVPGGGWGLIDDRGRPKTVYHHLRRALAPVAVWTTDEGLNGVAIHLANDGSEALRAQLRVTLYRDEHAVDSAQEPVELGAHSVLTRDAEALLGHFADIGWTYRFGPPAHDVIAVTLERGDADGREVLGQAFRFPGDRPTRRLTAEELGLRATASVLDESTLAIEVRSRRLAYGVQVDAPGFDVSDDAFTVEPGGMRSILLTARHPGATLRRAQLGAVNLRGRVGIRGGRA
ncbi:MAG TPA: hypothetical protein VII98_15300 [Solirubrobacteraceae bacterium]